MGDTDVKGKMLTFKGPIDIGLEYVKNICQSVTCSLNCVSNSENFLQYFAVRGYNKFFQLWILHATVLQSSVTLCSVKFQYILK